MTEQMTRSTNSDFHTKNSTFLFNAVMNLGDGANDLNVTGIREATVVGIKKDLILFGDPSSFSDRQLERSKSNDLSSRCGVVPQLDANNMYLDPRKAPPIPPSPSASSSGSSYDFAAVAAAAPPTAATTAATMYRQLDENL